MRDRRRTWRNDIDDANDADADAEYARNDAEYQAWLSRQWNRAVNTLEGYDEPDPAYDPRDEADRLEVEGGRL